MTVLPAVRWGELEQTVTLPVQHALPREQEQLFGVIVGVISSFTNALTCNMGLYLEAKSNISCYVDDDVRPRTLRNVSLAFHEQITACRPR